MNYYKIKCNNLILHNPITMTVTNSICKLFIIKLVLRAHRKHSSNMNIRVKDMNSNEQALSARNLYNATWKLLLVYINYIRWKMSTVMFLSFLFSSTLIFNYDPSSNFLGVRTAVFRKVLCIVFIKFGSG